MPNLWLALAVLAVVSATVLAAGVGRAQTDSEAEGLLLIESRRPYIAFASAASEAEAARVELIQGVEARK